MINPGLSLLNYKLHTQPKCQDWTFRTNSWIRYQLHSNHQFFLGICYGKFPARYQLCEYCRSDY